MAHRIERFVDAMNVQSTDRVLEIGCGHGVAGTLVCQKLQTGRYVAVDRSAKMIAAAARRNDAHVRSGLARFVVSDLESIDLGDEKFDKVFAMRVRIFRDEPEQARKLILRWLAPKGRIFIEYDEPHN